MLTPSQAGHAPDPQERSEAVDMATKLLHALKFSDFPHAASEELKQLAPQVMGDLLNELKQAQADLAAVRAQLEAKQEQVDIVMRYKNEWMDRAVKAEAALTELRARLALHPPLTPHQQAELGIQALRAELGLPQESGVEQSLALPPPAQESEK